MPDPHRDFSVRTLPMNKFSTVVGECLKKRNSKREKTHLKGQALDGRSRETDQTDFVRRASVCYAHIPFRTSTVQKETARLLTRGEQVLFRDIDYNVLNDQRLLVHRLATRAMPTVDGRYLWPSTPTLFEWMEMKKRGKTSHASGTLRGNTSAVTLGEFNRNAVIASKLVKSNVIGIRGDVRVPSRYLGSFRMKWGFLILTHPGIIPIGLARFLAGQWKRNPANLWLVRSVNLRTFLRAVPTELLKEVSSGSVMDFAIRDGARSVTDDHLSTTDYESDAESHTSDESLNRRFDALINSMN